MKEPRGPVTEEMEVTWEVEGVGKKGQQAGWEVEEGRGEQPGTAYAAPNSELIAIYSRSE